jgi:alanine racemase
MARGTRLELRPHALAANARRVRAFAGDARVYAMVKSNAYGHGLALASEALAPAVDGLGVAVLHEAAELRTRGYQGAIMVLEGIFDHTELAEAAGLDLEVVIHAEWQLALLENRPRPLRVWLKVNTGMHRLGVPAEQAPALLQRLDALDAVRVEGVMTHFACADQDDDTMTTHQAGMLTSLADTQDRRFSAANSAAVIRYPDSHGELVRPGIMVYGSSPFPGRSAAQLGLAVTQRFAASVIAINDVPAGGDVGYGATWRAPRDSRIGVVAAGYGDGYPRHAPSGTPVAVNGRRTELAGRVSMDMITVDLTDLPDTGVGDEVELWGDTVAVDEVAAASGTISYELFCQITERVERVIDPSAASSNG